MGRSGHGGGRMINAAISVAGQGGHRGRGEFE